MNVVFILSDQHNPFFTGCYGHPLAETPAIDGLAARGVRFENAYCNYPLCVPGRASMFTGRYVFEIGTWDNALPWTGTPQGWSHHFRRSHALLTTIGKLDFKPSADHGVENEIDGGHRKSRDIHGLFRHEPDLPPRWSKHGQMLQSGPRDDLSEQSFGDFAHAERAAEWIRNERPADRPWILNVNFHQPHPSWPCPPKLWEKWDARVKLEDLPEKYFEPIEKLHPFHQSFAHHQCGRYATDEQMRRGVAAYLAHCELVDRNVQRVLDGIDAAGIAGETLVIYASDHGENCRAHQIWGKMNMYEDAIRVPLVIAGPDVRRGAVESSPVSMLDIFPTCADAVGVDGPAEFRGISLLGQCRGDADAPRNEYVLSEYHANGFPAAAFAVSDGKMKYVECVGERPMLFDLVNDPQELHDRVLEQPDAPETLAAIRHRRAWLCELLSPEAVDARAKADQAALRREMEADGTLADEIHKRGYERRADRLVPRPETVPEGFSPCGK